MFNSSSILARSDELVKSSEMAKTQISMYENILNFRISSQKIIDSINKLPSIESSLIIDTIKNNKNKTDDEEEEDEELQSKTENFESDYRSIQKDLVSIQEELIEMLGTQLNREDFPKEDSDDDSDDDEEDIKSNKRSSSLITEEEEEDRQLWKKIKNITKSNLPKWKSCLNLWHNKLNYGKIKNNLKVFNTSLYDQINMILKEKETKNKEKILMSLQESQRIGIDSIIKKIDEIEGNDDPSITTDQIIKVCEENNLWFSDPFNQESELESSYKNIKKNKNKIKISSKLKIYDELVYDDRQFYSLLLKSFISSVSSSASASNTLGMRHEDLEALRRYKRKKINVDRKASKGRKIRYVVHPKLENFMFPIDIPLTNSLDIDRDVLFASLFQ